MGSYVFMCFFISIFTNFFSVSKIGTIIAIKGAEFLSNVGLTGMLLGVSIPFVVTAVAKMPTVITFWSLSLSFFISVAVGIAFGSYPAMRAAEQDPIVALRCD